MPPPPHIGQPFGATGNPACCWLEPYFDQGVCFQSVTHSQKVGRSLAPVRKGFGPSAPGYRQQLRHRKVDLADADFITPEIASIKREAFHGVVTTVAGPKPQVVDGGGGRDQSVSQFNVVTFGELPQKVSSALADRGIDGNTVDGCKKSLEGLIFLRPGTMPQFGDRNRRAEQRGAATAQGVPSSEQILVPGARDLNQDIRVDQESLQDEILVSRLPLRRRRT